MTRFRPVIPSSPSLAALVYHFLSSTVACFHFFPYLALRLSITPKKLTSITWKFKSRSTSISSPCLSLPFPTSFSFHSISHSPSHFLFVCVFLKPHISFSHPLPSPPRISFVYPFHIRSHEPTSYLNIRNVFKMMSTFMCIGRLTLACIMKTW